MNLLILSTFFTFLVFPVFVLTYPRPVPKVFKDCASACPLTCTQPKPFSCVLICKPGLVCPSGYYENSRGQCVLFENCDKKLSHLQDPLKGFLNHITFGHSGLRLFPHKGLNYGPTRPFPDDLNSDSSTDFTGNPNSLELNSAASEGTKIIITVGSARPGPIFQFSPVYYNATAVANGGPIPPPKIINTFDPNLSNELPENLPKPKVSIELDTPVEGYETIIDK